jgi:hypothetical protein
MPSTSWKFDLLVILMQATGHFHKDRENCGQPTLSRSRRRSEPAEALAQGESTGPAALLRGDSGAGLRDFGLPNRLLRTCFHVRLHAPTPRHNPPSQSQRVISQNSPVICANSCTWRLCLRKQVSFGKKNHSSAMVAGVHAWKSLWGCRQQERRAGLH